MIYGIKHKQFYKWFICVALAFFTHATDAQISYIQKAINKLESYDNFGYKNSYKEKEYTDDTLLINNTELFEKAPDDKVYGYLFSLKAQMEPSKTPRTDYYNGKTILSVYPGDSTYYTEKAKPSKISHSLIGRLYWFKNFLENKPGRLVKVADTTTHGIDSYHFIINTRDTIIDKEHYYTRINVFIDKLSDMPVSMVSRAKSEKTVGKPTYYYSEAYYFDYEFNQANVDIASVAIPPGYHLPKALPILLTPGTIAPDWNLNSTNGKKVSLSQLKGNVVLMDFYFIGCHACIESLESLNNLYQKYKGENFVIASITGRDKLKAVSAFDKNQHITYPSLVNGADVVKSYHVNDFPTFYFIDKEGKVAEVIIGYDKGFETKATSTIDALLKK